MVERGPLIHYLSAERDLVPSGELHAAGEGMLVLGSPAFDDVTPFAALAPEQKPGKGTVEKLATLVSFRGQRSACGDFKAMRFGPLPQSRLEAEEIAHLWKKGSEGSKDVVALTGAEANEAAFKMKAPGRRVLHLATHGFFLEGRCPSGLSGGQRGTGPGTPEERRLLPSVGENPLLLTGLALAGANHREAAGPEEEDGILTAEEVASLDLSGMDWSVLSACDTGTGKIEEGEGIFGLRRSFHVAGARTLVTSLWKVEDEAAREWMRALYKARFVKGMRTAQSVREANLKVLRERRKKGRSTHPFYWGGFVASGDWR
jgi:CHAT domain-containing protein